MDRASLLFAAAADVGEAILLYYKWIVLAGCYRRLRTPNAIARHCPRKTATTCCLRAVLCCRRRGSCVTLWASVASQAAGSTASAVPFDQMEAGAVYKLQRPSSVNQHMGQPTVTNDETKSQATTAP